MTVTSEEKPQFRLNDFEGPLDLLLFLVKKNEVNIYDIPIGLITEQYLEFIRLSTHVDLENITEFYSLAATLLYIKSRMLLPVELDLDEELEDPRQELIEKLIEYQKYKHLAELMVDQEHQTEWLLERKKKQTVLPFEEKEDFWQKMEVWDLLKTFSQIMGSLSSEKIMNLYEEVTINEKISLMYELLEKKTSFSFTELITREGSILDVICAFLAILEMVKAKKIQVFQNKFFGDIQISAQMEPLFSNELGDSHG